MRINPRIPPRAPASAAKGSGDADLFETSSGSLGRVVVRGEVGVVDWVGVGTAAYMRIIKQTKLMIMIIGTIIIWPRLGATHPSHGRIKIPTKYAYYHGLSPANLRRSEHSEHDFLLGFPFTTPGWRVEHLD